MMKSGIDQIGKPNIVAEHYEIYVYQKTLQNMECQTSNTVIMSEQLFLVVFKNNFLKNNFRNNWRSLCS